MLCENRARPESVTFPPGISEKEAHEKLKEFGENTLCEKKKRCAFLKKALLSFADVMTLVLAAAAAVSFAVAKLRGESAVDSYMILAIVFLNGIVTAFQETRAEKALEALKTLTSPECTAVREGIEKRIPAKYIVPGDVILVKKGDSVPADAVILQSVSLRADESALTGESGGVEKSANAFRDAKTHATPPDMIFAGTVITSGSAAARVTETGMRTRMGKIAEMLVSEPVPRTPMQTRMAKISAKLGNAAIGICFVIFLLSLYKGVPPDQAFLNSVSLAVAAIPEGLPAVVTVMLSVGVTEMAKKRAVVKKLPAVETLGCAAVICSDKTGTLTQNKLEVTETEGERRLLARLFALCNHNSSPTENALWEFAGKTLGEHALRLLPPIVREAPFEHETRVMATLHREKSGGYLAVVKGAPEEVLRLCGVSARAYGRFAAKGLRTIACGYARLKTAPGDLLKIRYSYAGCAGMTDPPRPEAFEAVRACRSAGIKTVMITGDHPDTAFAVALKLGIASSTGDVATQAQIEALPAAEQEKAILRARVFARSAPEFKVKIIHAYKNAGAICAMTGDGV
ncbi:MAG: HAD-IC family P-type ATPase, partial [Clostridia bacterium]|nr:HAD-IC family P-type ATPase [Clostridia bacterium]